MATEEASPPRAAAAPAATTAVEVRLEGLRKTYGDVIALAHLDLEVRAGEFFTLLGPSGSGKTTTLRLVAGFERADHGRVVLGGTDVTGRPPYDRDVNTVFQDYALFPHMSIADNVGYGLRVRKVPRAERRARVEEALHMVRLPDVGGRRPLQLSGGQRQRVALARALVNRPRVLLLDEPLGALDLKLRQEMQLELKRLQGELGITFVYVTHDQDEALGMSDRIGVFSEGRLEQVGTPREVYEHPTTEFVAGFVGTSNILERDGRRFTVRPEKIRLLAPGERVGEGWAEEPGTVRETVYLGSVTRYVVSWRAARRSPPWRRTSRRRRTTRRDRGGRSASRGAAPARRPCRPDHRRRSSHEEPLAMDRHARRRARAVDRGGRMRELGQLGRGAAARSCRRRSARARASSTSSPGRATRSPSGSSRSSRRRAAR